MPDALLVAILAAGASRRLGRPKQLLEVNGETLVRRQCRTALEAEIGPVALVVGCQQEQVASAVADLTVQLLVNETWEEGMAASVRTATRAAMAAGAEAMLLYHCDQYGVTVADLTRVHQLWTNTPRTARLSRDGSHLGPPAVLPARLFPAVMTLEGDTGPRAILSGDTDVREVLMPSASWDIDRAADLAIGNAHGFNFTASRQASL